jgi:hypothetical protein
MERKLRWWRKYVLSTDHKVIGIQYAISGFAFFFFGFCLMMMMRWQLTYPGRPLPIIGKLFGSSMPGGVIDAPSFGRCHLRRKREASGCQTTLPDSAAGLLAWPKACSAAKLPTSLAALHLACVQT